MEGIKKLFWRQGVFLQPQHFQLTDMAEDARFQALQTYGFLHFRGVVAMDVNEASLATQSFDLRGGEFFFDDGAYVSIPGNASPQRRSFKDVWTESEKPMDVYLGLHRLNPWGKNVTETASPEEAGHAATRYVTGLDPEEAPDYHFDGPPAKIKRLEMALKLFFETEKDQMNDYHVIHLARLEREGERIVLSNRFIPPCVSIGASPVLDGLFKEIRDLAASRCRVLEQYKSPNTVRRTGLDFRYMVYLMALAVLNRHVPVLNHISAAKSIHPWQAFVELFRFVGELSTFSSGVNAFGEGRGGSVLLPAYDHDDLWSCFSAARKLCGELLEGIVLGPEYLIPLERGEEFFSASPPEGVFSPDHAYWLILKTEKDIGHVLSTVNQHLKLSASLNISTLIALAVPGAPLQYSEEPPSGMPSDPTVRYFTIERNSPQWLEIEKTRTISLYWPDAPADLAAEIAVMRK